MRLPENPRYPNSVHWGILQPILRQQEFPRKKQDVDDLKATGLGTRTPEHDDIKTKEEESDRALRAVNEMESLGSRTYELAMKKQESKETENVGCVKEDRYDIIARLELSRQTEIWGEDR